MMRVSSGIKLLRLSFSLRCARTPVIIQTPGLVPAGTRCCAEPPRCQFNATWYSLLSGTRKRTSKYVSSERLDPVNAAVNEPPGRTHAGSNRILVTVGDNSLL